MSVKFPYQKSSLGFFPVIEITLFSGKKKTPIKVLVDSGATISIFSAKVAEVLGIKIQNDKKVYLGGVGGRILGYVHKLQIELGGKKFICPIVFSEEYKVSFNLLGRQGIFDKFVICFDDKKKKLTVS